MGAGSATYAAFYTDYCATTGFQLAPAQCAAAAAAGAPCAQSATQCQCATEQCNLAARRGPGRAAAHGALTLAAGGLAAVLLVRKCCTVE